ncbi:MerR family transcriptional regulator [Extibacter muris]|uniref:MerR family transcriptional regulator n=1 Tax=Extibacter muris TaxID=1796622 RepID=UPI001D06CF12|nr:MerR family transcriptional regulator [Extibacter muris]MCB6203118.1 MerR family transcriptional regulator [Extibacter muris]MCQ4664343.1 MerR family transcriptional regulator [Extibacter muris]MCQ4692319.1 MerR family transcriptional regulator [Extibacter muris]MCQ4692436.1 MerR family transcriptional regulator [Extibacter muris]
MEKYRAIPQGYMTVGEIAKKMGITVRTLQHYDREGVLSPSSVSAGGRRLYTDKDIVKLHQILSLKHLGFSLDDIKNRLISMDTPAEVADALAKQAAAVREKIDRLSESLRELDLLQKEVLQMKSVDFKKYADIIVNLQMQNDYYWLIKHFDDQMLDHIRKRFDMESSTAFMQKFMSLQEKAVQLEKEGVLPDSDEGQRLAETYWNMILEFTGGDMGMLSKLVDFGQSDGFDQEWKEKQDFANTFIEPALEAYFSRLGTDPFQEVTK